VTIRIISKMAINALLAESSSLEDIEDIDITF
jgi:hypothetical protein